MVRSSMENSMFRTEHHNLHTKRNNQTTVFLEGRGATRLKLVNIHVTLFGVIKISMANPCHCWLLYDEWDNDSCYCLPPNNATSKSSFLLLHLSPRNLGRDVPYQSLRGLGGLPRKPLSLSPWTVRETNRFLHIGSQRTCITIPLSVIKEVKCLLLTLLSA